MTVIPIEKIKYEIVTSASEDISGLYEVIWALNTLYPEISKADKIEFSKLAIIELLENQVINLYKRNWDTHVENKLEKNEALKIIADDMNWDVPSKNTNGDYYCFFTNGDKALEEENKLYILINGG